MRRILRPERLRSDDVADAEASCDQRNADDTLRLTCDVGRRPLIDDDQDGSDCIDEVDSCKQRGLVGFCCERHEPATQDTGHTAGDDPGPSVGGVAHPKSNDESTGD